MFKTLFFAFVLATLTVNIIFLFATKDKPPDPTGSTTTLVSVIGQGGGRANGLQWAASITPDSPVSQPASLPGRRLFLRSNDFYDYPSAASAAAASLSLKSAASYQLEPIDNNNRSSSGQTSGSTFGKSIGGELQIMEAASQEAEPKLGNNSDTNNNNNNKTSINSDSVDASNLFTPQPQTRTNTNNEEDQTNKTGLLFYSSGSSWLKQSRRQRAEATTRHDQRHTAGDSLKLQTAVAPIVSGTRTGAPSTGDDNDELGNEKPNDGNKATGSLNTPTRMEAVVRNGIGNGNKEAKSSNRNINDETANEITRVREASPRTGASPANTLAIRVKSSKNHVLIKVDNLIIYESGLAGTGSGVQRNKQQQQHGTGDKTSPSTTGTFNKRARRRARRHQAPRQDRSLAPSTDDKNANQLATDDWTDTNINNNNNNKHNGEPPMVESSNNAPATATTTPGRGIHVLVLNQFDGFVMSKRLFDTYSPQQDDELALYLGQIQAGRLVIMAVQDEASFKMARSSAARKLIESTLGSRHIMDLDWRDMWALIGVKRLGGQLETNRTLGESTRLAAARDRDSTNKPLAEGHSRSARFTDWAPPVELTTEFSLEVRTKLVENNEKRCEALMNDATLETKTRRRLFCNRIEGYGRVCDCRHPSKLDFEPSPVEHSQLDNVPIVVIASNRPYYLYRMLRSLLQAKGVQRSMVTVFIDGFYDEPAEICKLLKLRYIQNKPESSKSARISHHYKTSLMLTFERLFPSAQFAIIFEEDLDVARDALVYFNQTKHLLENDPSLYCVSAWNDQGYEHSIGDLRQLLRVETMPGLGWMLSRRLFVDELKNKWPASSQQHDWDMWIRTAQVRRGRECIIPDVSRTYHFGSTGTNINSYFQRQYFNKHAFSDNMIAPDELTGHNEFKFDNLDQLDAVGYEQIIEQLLNRDLDDYDGPILRHWFSSESLLDDGHQLNDQYQTTTSSRLMVIHSQALCAYSKYNLTNDNLANRIIEKPSHHKQQLSRPGHFLAGQNNRLDQLVANTTTHTKTSTLNVIFIKMIDSEDYRNWLKLAKCWRLWDLDARGQHKSMWRLYANGQQTLVVGHPASPYSKFKPVQVAPYDF